MSNRRPPPYSNAHIVLYNEAMPASVLATKLYVPQTRSTLVPRPRLIERLNTGLYHKLTIIAAPAGFGKTTLLSEWVGGGGRPAAWLSLDERDSDLSRFLTYLITALQTIRAEIGVAIMPALESSSAMPIESLLTTLINDISAIHDDFILVLDDYHLIDSQPVDSALTFLLEHLPPQMHLGITSREDPNLPLARFRARDQLTELRVADLRFTPAEAAEFLNQVMDLDLSAEEVAILETRTEGWIAGLQLAALSMHTHQDVSGFIRAFAGNHRYIMDYLVEEVLNRQPQPVRNFLLQTAILDRMNGPLCDAVTGQQGGSARLEALQRGNFFVIPLDDHRHWYRYHHLFAEVLRTYLMAEQSTAVSALHRRASAWFEHNGSAAEAIRHALAAQDFEQAATLIERALPATRQSRQEATLLSWLRALPEELFQDRPVLSVHFAGALLQNGQLAGVAARLRDAERWLGEDVRGRPVFVDEEDFHRLPALVAMYHAAIALAQGDSAGTMAYARRAIDLTREEDGFMRGALTSLMGLASWTSGDLATAYQMYAGGMAHLLKVGYTSDVIGGSVTLADLRLAQGRLREALGHYERGLQLATQPGRPALRDAADMHVGLSEIYRQRNELDIATQHLLKSQSLGELNGLPKNPYRWRVASARLRQARGDSDGALDLLNEAERLYTSDFSPNVRPVAAIRARVWAAQGRLDEALGWARAQGLSAEDDPHYLREYEHITLARVRLAQHRRDDSDNELRATIGLLERLLSAAEAGGRTGSVIELLILLALALQMMTPANSDDIAALAPLERALSLAEPEG